VVSGNSEPTVVVGPAAPVAAGPPNVRWIPVDAIEPGPYQPRHTPTPEQLAALAESIATHGIIEPLIVRPAGGGFELIAGERRWRAARLAGLHSVPALVRECSDREAAVWALVENLQRSDLHFFEEAEGYRRLLEEFRLTQADLARQVGRSQPAVANKLRLLQLEPEVRSRIEGDARLSERHARALLRLPDPESRQRGVEAFTAAGMSVRGAEAWVERQLREPSRPKRRVVRVVRDLRIFLNAFRQAASALREAGFRVDLAEEDRGDVWEITVRIGKDPRSRPS
jgi:ParB family chromosome partitioning protein